MDNGRLPSAALGIGIGDRVCVKETFGATSITPEGAPVREDTLYDMASVSKVLSTSMIALRFIAEGILDLADMLPRYFGEDAVPEDKKEISLFHLLTHTSGYPAHIPLYEKIPTPDLTVPYLLSVPLEHAPGTRVVYSCMGFILLGKMLERISGIRIAVAPFSRLMMFSFPDSSTPLACCAREMEWNSSITSGMYRSASDTE